MARRSKPAASVAESMEELARDLDQAADDEDGGSVGLIGLAARSMASDHAKALRRFARRAKDIAQRLRRAEEGADVAAG